MIEKTISTRQAREFYNRLGHRYDWTTFFESSAKSQALERLALQPGLKVLDVGTGTGHDLALIQSAVEPGGLAVGLDSSYVMAQIAARRGPAAGLQGLADQLPFKLEAFDRIYAGYLLDLLPAGLIPGVLRAFRRVLQPEGHLVLLSLTEGVDAVSRLIVGGWKLIYRAAPIACGGCRPLRLEGLARAAGLEILSNEIVKEWGIPSELVVVK
jgi:ubiquinone/menaquinone biosynthesis C-methylase UbiE